MHAKDGLLVDAQSALMTFQSSEMSASAQLKEIKRELERLHPMCIQGEETVGDLCFGGLLFKARG